MKIRSVTITDQMGLLIDVLINDGLQCGYLFIFNGNSPHGAAALSGNQHSLFGRAFAAFVHNTWFWLRCAANKLFIKFYNTLKHPGIGAVWVHHLSDNMAHAPSCRLGDTE